MIASLLLTLGGIIINVMIVPTLLDSEAAVPRLQSIPSTIALVMMVAGYIMSGLFFPAIPTAIGALLWAGVAVYRST